ncbi:MAG: mannose-1-phosphate guanylyltransferase [bacterium]|nr:mannose-1-phosphate guanylyltransferase [bacterium]
MTYAIIMAGGIGSRFWPLSRRNRPKQLLNIFGDRSLIQETIDRLQPLIPPTCVRIVTIEEQIPALRKELPMLQKSSFLAEPLGRNTAPCIGLAAIHLAHVSPQAVLVVLPADHKIAREDDFRDILAMAISRAERGEELITIGIRPTRPETGYGYIQFKGSAQSHGIHKVKTFAEKPDRKMAEQFLHSGDFLWNAGIFIARADTLLEEFQKYLPDFHHDLMEYSKSIGTPHEMRARKQLYNATKSISFDYGIMEHADKVLVIPADIGWSDVGNWNEVKRQLPVDDNGNSVFGDGMTIASSNSFVHSPEHFTAIVGLENVVVVHTPDATLVCHLDRVQEVREIVAALDREKRINLL